MNLLNFVAFVILAISTSCKSAEQKIRIDLYYESLCIYSKRFISENLKPIYEEIKDVIDIHYIPFGKCSSSNDNGNITFECQHHEPECKRNAFQLCALHFIGPENKDRQSELVFCTMGFTYSYETCAGRSNLNLTAIEECRDGSLGIQLQLAAEEVTKPVVYGKSGYVPTIVFNGVYDIADYNAAQENLSKLIKEKREQLA